MRLLCLALIIVHQICGSFPLSIRSKRETCRSIHFQCNSGECIEKFLPCDGRTDCKDGSDETEDVCKNMSCAGFAFRCEYGACVDADAKCNGKVDCADNSDEKGCARGANTSCKSMHYQCKSFDCIDPLLLCDGTKHCEDGSDETAEACSDFTCPGFGFQCDYGGCINRNGLCNGVVQCADGSDENPERCARNASTQRTSTATKGAPTIAPFEAVSCSPLVNPTREIVCKLNGKIIDCEKPMPPGTIASLKCDTFYKHTSEYSTYDSVCNADGHWSRDIKPCIPTCGNPNPSGIPLIANAVTAKMGEFPWHAGIYEYVSSKGVMRLICGGSIISELHIISASHCFWDENIKKKADIKNFQVVVGKYFREWNTTTTHVQIPEICEIKVYERYLGADRLYENDIAIIILKNHIKMTIAVRPICIDLDNQFKEEFMAATEGIVVGWGITETKNQSEVLHTATMPYVHYETCITGVPESFVPYITTDKFCAGYQNGTSVCPGDSGGGYATRFKDGKWYLMGIVSTGAPTKTTDEACNVKHYTTFTRVAEYNVFINKYSSQTYCSVL